MKGQRKRAWCLTINNYKPEDCEWDLDDLPIDYLILGKEVGKEGTPHLQGFLYSKNKVSFGQLKKIFPTAHIEPKSKKSTLASAIEYCMKDNDYLEFGDRPRQGKRTDLDLIKHDLQRNVPIEAIADRYFSRWCQYRRAFDEYSTLKRARKTQVIVIKHDNFKSWEQAQKYMRGKYIVLDESTLSKLYSLYFGKVYDYIITPNSCYIDDFTDKNNLIII